ncbi:MAG TPA: hypothetical protein VM510_05375, partial [Caulifigura sp.]|nr:hypothetical protein [Caulifigura sp.]
MLVSLFLSREGLARRRLFAAALAVSVWSGCGFGGASELAPISVTGKISLDGRPLGEGTVVLISQKGVAASGDIQ